MKNLRNILVALAFAGLSAGAVNAQVVGSGSCGANGNNLTWQLTGTSDSLTLTISGMGAMANYDYSNAPWSSQRANIKTLVLASGMTTIGNGAFFDCRGLTSVTIPNNVTSIGNSAFYDCRGLTSLTIPDSVTSIGNKAFLNCSSLTDTLTIPSSVTTIGESAFRGCSSLTSIDVDERNTQYSSIDGVLFNKPATTLITCPAGKQNSYIIPSSVTTIGSMAFYDCIGLTSVTIPNSVTTIREHALDGCLGLTSITIPNSVTTIENMAFFYCLGLTDVYVSWAIPLSIYSGVFYVLTLSNMNLHIPSGTKCLYSRAPVWENFNIIGTLPTITATAGSNGGISPSGTTEPITCGDNKTYTFTPDDGYVIDEVLIDNIPNAAAKENGYHTFRYVIINHTISVTFKTAVGIADIPANSISIYPNPTQDKLTIAGGDLQINRVEICDLAGRVVLLPSFGGVGGGAINVSALPAGIYLVKIHTDKGLVTRKAVKN